MMNGLTNHTGIFFYPFSESRETFVFAQCGRVLIRMSLAVQTHQTFTRIRRHATIDTKLSINSRAPRSTLSLDGTNNSSARAGESVEHFDAERHDRVEPVDLNPSIINPLNLGKTLKTWAYRAIGVTSRAARVSRIRSTPYPDRSKSRTRAARESTTQSPGFVYPRTCCTCSQPRECT